MEVIPPFSQPEISVNIVSGSVQKGTLSPKRVCVWARARALVSLEGDGRGERGLEWFSVKTAPLYYRFTIFQTQC